MNFNIELSKDQARSLVEAELDRLRPLLAEAEANAEPLRSTVAELGRQLESNARRRRRAVAALQTATDDAVNAAQQEVSAARAEGNVIEGKVRKAMRRYDPLASEVERIRRRIEKLERAIGLRSPLFNPSPLTETPTSAVIRFRLALEGRASRFGDTP